MTHRTCITCGARLRANARALVCQPCSEAKAAQWLAELEAMAAADTEAEAHRLAHKLREQRNLLWTLDATTAPAGTEAAR